MNDKEIKELMESVATKSKELNEKMEGFENQITEIKEIAEKNEGKTPEALGQELTKLEETAEKASTEYKGLFDSQKELNEKMQEQLDALDVSYKRADLSENDKKNYVKNFVIESKEGFEKIAAGDMNSVRMSLKVGDMTLANTFTDEVIDRDRIPGIWFDAERLAHIRDFMNITPVSTDVIRWVKETAYDDGTGTTAEGSAATQSDFDLTSQDETVRKINTFLTISKEMMTDADFVENYIRTRAFSKIMKEEDDQILNGDNTGTNLNGLKLQAQAYVDNLADSNVNTIDVITAAGTGVRVDEYTPNIALIHPNDFQDIILEKDSDGRYQLPNVFTGMPLIINGARVVANTAVTEDEFFVGDLIRAVTLALRSGIEMTFTNSHASNFTKGFTTILIEERLTQVVYQPKALVFGDFTAALGDGTA